MSQIFIAEAQPFLPDSLSTWLPKMDTAFEIVAVTAQHQEILEKIATECPEIVLLDSELFNGEVIPVMAEICKHGLVKVVIWSAGMEAQTVRALVQAGVQGYILKTETRETILEAMHAIAQGETWYSQPAANLLIQQFIPEDTLTTQEQRVLHLLAQGYTSKQMAVVLNIGRRTVETHVGKIYKKLGAKNKGDAVRIAGEKGLLRKAL
jgi:DNA-binding NarL/FixJ family response regulator